MSKKIEEEFGTVKNKIVTLTEKLEAQTKDLIGYSTGGDSIAYFFPSFMSGQNGIALNLTNQSDYPALDIQVQWIDLNEPVDTKNGKFWTRHTHIFGNLYPKKGIMDALKFNIENIPELRINIFIQTRNNSVSQALRMVKVDGVPKIAYQVKGDEIIEQHVPDDFPNFDKNKPEMLFD